MILSVGRGKRQRLLELTDRPSYVLRFQIPKPFFLQLREYQKMWGHPDQGTQKLSFFGWEDGSGRREPTHIGAGPHGRGAIRGAGRRSFRGSLNLHSPASYSPSPYLLRITGNKPIEFEGVPVPGKDLDPAEWLTVSFTNRKDSARSDAPAHLVLSVRGKQRLDLNTLWCICISLCISRFQQTRLNATADSSLVPLPLPGQKELPPWAISPGSGSISLSFPGPCWRMLCSWAPPQEAHPTTIKQQPSPNYSPPHPSTHPVFQCFHPSPPPLALVLKP